MNNKIKVLLACIMAFILMISVTAFASVGTTVLPVSYSDIKIVLDGTRIIPKDANGTIIDPFIYEGTTYLPVRAISEALGLNVEWVEAESSVILTSGGEKKLHTDEDVYGLVGGKGIDVEYNDIKIYIDGELLEPKDANGEAVEPFISEGTTYLPLRAISQALGLTVGWDEETQTVSLLTSAEEMIPPAEDPGEYPVVEIVMENGDIITAELYPEVAPVTVGNFLKLIDEKFYDGLIFHRVIPGFVIQGGGITQDFVQKPCEPIVGEFASNGFENNLKHTRGVLSMARTREPDSASSQFFIMIEDAPHLDGEYAAFGKVIDGMDVADRIVSVDRDEADCPFESQVIETIRLKADAEE